MLHKTRGIILHTVKYGETSLIATIYTELFGIQSYMVKGVRQSTKKTSAKATMFQPAALLDMIVYHNELKHLQIIKEFKWYYLYQELYRDIIKNCVALFIIELVTKSIKRPESNASLFTFIEDHLLQLDTTDAATTANFPLYFALQFAHHLGFGVEDHTNLNKAIFDIREGVFTNEIPLHSSYLNGHLAEVTAKLLAVKQINHLSQIKLNKQQRQQLLQAYEQFYLYHIADFGNMKTLSVLETILS